ncbi:MAG: FixH family protein [Hyphomonadaceae bacterium]|nr:FixH family protein [Hyphomonadaceae bacterium]
MSTFTLRGGHVAWGMGGFFALILAVNIGFTVLALSSFPGEAAPKAYVLGLRYNEALAEKRAQAALGWRAGVALQRGVVRVRLLDGAGAGLEGAQVRAQLGRPAAGAFDRALAFRPVGGGFYEASLPADLGPGRWRLRAIAVRNGQSLNFEKELQWTAQ